MASISFERLRSYLKGRGCLEDRLTLTEVAQVKAALHPLRQKLMHAFDAEPVTPSELARRVGIAASKAHYHVRVLEKAGLVRLVETRAVGSVTEKYYQMAAHHFALEVRRDPEQCNEVMPLIEAEVQTWLRDLKATLALDDPTSHSHLAIHRSEATPQGKALVEESVRALLAKVDETLVTAPGKRHRLLISWTPMQEED
jgi:DNA-binding transcriptional ArsR family regulator